MIKQGDVPVTLSDLTLTNDLDITKFLSHLLSNWHLAERSIKINGALMPKLSRIVFKD